MTTLYYVGMLRSPVKPCTLVSPGPTRAGLSVRVETKARGKWYVIFGEDAFTTPAAACAELQRRREARVADLKREIAALTTNPTI